MTACSRFCRSRPDPERPGLVGTGQLYTWRKQLLRGAMAGFVPVELVKPEPAGKLPEAGRIDIRRGEGFTVSVDRLVDREALKLVLEIVGELER